MSSFALDPPPGVVAVSFFVTARYAAQDDSEAFTAAVTGQLEELLGPDFSVRQGTRNDRARYLLLLSETAQYLRASGERLVLIVDGLDEDRGADRGLPSIASLLPKHCEHGLKVIVSGRPHPKIPADVPADHPLHDDARIMHTLKPYPGAERNHRTAELELAALLTGTTLERDLVGLITAARGGLSGADLAELTQLPPFQVNSVLRGAAGRVFTTRHAVGDADDRDRVYLLAHETLQVEAKRSFGEHLGAYRDRLHALAGDYQLRKWPPETPQYLLRGYFAMLNDTRDIRRLIDCATDEARHDRMLSSSGSDSAGLAEVSIAQKTVLAESDPDLNVMARLAFHREELATRNVGMPVTLPAVWAAVGQADRAESLATSLMPAGRKSEALARVARALAVAGQYERAVRVAEDAERVAQPLASHAAYAAACAEVAVAFAAVGSRERADGLAELITDTELRQSTQYKLAAAYAATGLHAQAIALTGLIADVERQSAILSETARFLAESNLHDHARNLSGEASTLSRSIGDCLQGMHDFTAAVRESAILEIEPSAIDVIAEIADVIAKYSVWVPRYYGVSYARMASALGGAGLRAKAATLVDHAEPRNESARDPKETAATLAELAAACAASGLPERAERIARSIADSGRQSEALARIAAVAASAGLTAKAAELANDAELAARSAIPPHQQVDDLCRVSRAFAQAGFLDQAASLASDAIVAARHLSDPAMRALALAESAWVLTEAGQEEQAGQLADEAEAAAGLIVQQRHLYTVWLAYGLAEAGMYDKAEAVARSIRKTWPEHAPGPAHGYQAQALAMISVPAANAGRRATAARLAADAATMIQLEKNDSLTLADAQAATAHALAASGLHVRATSLAGSIASPGDRVEAYANMAMILMKSGSREEAARLAEEAETAALSEEDPESRAEAMADAAAGLASAGLYARAETLASSIGDSRQRAVALSKITARMASSGLHETAELLAQSVSEPDMQGSALASVAKALHDAGDQMKARRTLAKALDVGPWQNASHALISVAPDVLATIGGLLVDRQNSHFTENKLQTSRPALESHTGIPLAENISRNSISSSPSPVNIDEEDYGDP